ncbi:MAG: type II secretion system minor pseudopilin GspK [Nitrospiraceae bacterium]|nr:MAG: type II secretion system minor pseudopilin GspK [Nitrospiraceae bacterium]
MMIAEINNKQKSGSVTDQSPVVDNRGSALIITLLLITILVGLVVNFVYEVYMDSSAVSNWSNAQRASYIAKSGQNIAVSFIKQVKLYPPTNIREIALPVAIDFGPASSLAVMVEDENSKFNLNKLTDDKSVDSLKKLFEYLKINPDLALLIADWRDPDSDPRTSESEDLAKNGEFWSIDELKLIKGIDNEVFAKISPYVTATSNWFGWKVNINTADLPVLFIMDDQMTITLAESIIDYRKDTPFETVEQVQNISGLEKIGINFIGKSDVRSENYRVTTRAVVNDVTRVIESIVDTSSRIYFWREI